MRKNNALKTIFWCLILLTTLQSCYEATTACLDIQATNFDIDADNACLDCCTYPKIKLAFDHEYAITPDSFVNLKLVDSVYLDGAGNAFRFNRVQFYVSNFRLVRTGGGEVGVIDTVGMDIVSSSTGNIESIVVEDNFLLANPLITSTLTIGDFRESGTFSGIRFDIGIAGEPNQAFPTSLPDDHPLSTQDPAMHFDVLEDGYIFTRMELFRDIVETDTIPIVLEIGMPTNLKTIELPANFEVKEGFDVTFAIRVNYAKWMEGISVGDDYDNGQLKSKIVENLTKDLFEIVELK